MRNTKRTLYAAVVTGLLAFTGMQAQEKTAAFGFKGGLNFSNFYTDSVDDKDVLTGFNAGLYAKLPITNSIAIQPEINFTTKGSEVLTNNTSTKLNLNYIEVPVLLVANLTENFNIHVGPYAAYMVSSKGSFESNFGSITQTFDTDDFNKFDAGISAGVGIDLDAVNFGVRYNYGLTKISDNNNFDAKNSVFNAYIGLRLN